MRKKTGTIHNSNICAYYLAILLPCYHQYVPSFTAYTLLPTLHVILIVFSGPSKGSVSPNKALKYDCYQIQRDYEFILISRLLY